MTLYQIENGIGRYWVAAEDPTAAVQKLKIVLDNADYGFSDNRKARIITVIAEGISPCDRMITGKFFIP